MKDLIIYGAGDVGEEIVWYIEDINEGSGEWNLLGFVDDSLKPGTEVSGFPVLGGMEYMLSYKKEVYVICSIALPDVKKSIIERLLENENIKFPVLIHPKAVVAGKSEIGEGVLIGPGAVISVKTKIGPHTLVKQLASVGHHSEVGAYSLVAPGCCLGGHSHIGCSVDMGIGSSVMMLAEVGDNVILGAGAVVIKNIPSGCTAVGIPAKPIKFRE